MYRAISKRAYTRREYMGGVPGSKVVQFDMGNTKEQFPVEVSILAEEACQIQNKALEAEPSQLAMDSLAIGVQFA